MSTKKFSAGAILGIALGAIIIILGAWGVGSYNGLVGLRETVDSQASTIETQLQRRADLIPNLVSTVKGLTNHESEILSEIANSRAKLAGSTTMAEKATADSSLSDAVSRLLVIVEDYPNIKADAQFTALMDELSGTENRITVARKDYNSAVQSYNRKIKTFPANIVANMFGYESVGYFEASSSAAQTPTISFN